MQSPKEDQKSRPDAAQLCQSRFAVSNSQRGVANLQSMSVEKRDPTFAERFVAPLLGIFMVSPLLAAGMYFGCRHEHERLGIIGCCVTILSMVVALAILHNRVLGHYRCPHCRSELPRHKDPERPGDYLIYCKVCDVIWKTGLREGD